MADGQQKGNSLVGLVVGLVVGLAAGAVAGLLMAPVTGREARRRLSETRVRVTAEAGELLERVGELGEAFAEWASRAVGAEASRTRTRLAELRADVERLAAGR